MKFKSFEESLFKSPLVISDYAKIEIPPLLHMSLNALLEFTSEKNGESPRLHNDEDAKCIIEILKKKNEENKSMDIKNAIKLETKDENLVSNLVKHARAQISPSSSFWGGIVAQEIVKRTGKYTPLY